MPRYAILHEQAEKLLGARLFILLRYLISGGTAAATNLLIFSALVYSAHMYYLYASILAFVMSIAVSFTLQKFWTFRDMPLHDVHSQFARYIIVIVFNLILNTILVYILVETTRVWYVVAQGIATIVIAIVGYFAYRHFVFRDRTPAPTP